jgi:hypothetical protein
VEQLVTFGKALISLEQAINVSQHEIVHQNELIFTKTLYFQALTSGAPFFPAKLSILDRRYHTETPAVLPSFRLDGSRRPGCARSLPGRLCRFVRGNLLGRPADALVRHLGVETDHRPTDECHSLSSEHKCHSGKRHGP